MGVQILSWDNDLSQHEEKSVVATFIPALDRMQQTAPDAATLLRVLCFCDAESIPISILEQGCTALRQEDRDGSLEESVAHRPETVGGLGYS